MSAMATARASPVSQSATRRVGVGGGRHTHTAARGRRRVLCTTRRTSSTITRVASGESTPLHPPDPDGAGDFKEFTRDTQGRVVDVDGVPVPSPENGWVNEMEKEWATTGYDDRFFDDDWDEVRAAEEGLGSDDETLGPKPKDTEPVYPFADITDDEWKETMTWADEAFEENDPMMVVGGPVAGPGPSTEQPGRPPPFRDESSPASTIRNTPGPDPIDTQSKEMDADLTEAQEAAVMGFASGLDGNQKDAEPEGPPCVLLAGFKAEELPRVRELLDELGGHDIPVVPVAQTYLTKPLLETLAIEEPTWEVPRREDEFNKGGEYGSKRCVVFSGLDKGEMATIISAIEARGLPRLITVVITSENCEKTLGEALAAAVLESRVEKKRKEAIKNVDVERAVREIENAARRETLSPQELVLREIKRQDGLAADAAAAFQARDERASLKEQHLEKLKQKYVEKAKARAAAEAAMRDESGDPSFDASNPMEWPTLEDVEGSFLGANKFELDLDDIKKASGADGDALEAMVRDAMRDGFGGGVEAPEATVTKSKKGKSKKVRVIAIPPVAPFAEPSNASKQSPPVEAIEGREVEIDPTRWANRVDRTYEVITSDTTKTRTTATRTEGSPLISEPKSSQPNPEFSRPAIKDAKTSGSPPERTAATRNAQSNAQSNAQIKAPEEEQQSVMTKRMLRELAVRRGVSYAELLEKARASGVELPET